MENIKWYDLRNSKEDQNEKERFEQASDLLYKLIVFDSPREPGGFIKRYGHKFSRLHELKAHHFNNTFRKLKLNVRGSSKIW